MEESRETLTAAEIEGLARFDEHWRVILADDNGMLVRSLAKRGYLDVLRRRHAAPCGRGRRPVVPTLTFSRHGSIPRAWPSVPLSPVRALELAKDLMDTAVMAIKFKQWGPGWPG